MIQELLGVVLLWGMIGLLAGTVCGLAWKNWKKRK